MVDNNIVIQHLDGILYYNDKLKLEDKDSKELEKMLIKHQRSIYRKIMDLLGREYSKNYFVKEIAIKGTLDYKTETNYK